MSQDAIPHHLPEPEGDLPEEPTSIAHRGKFLIGMIVLVGALGYFGFLAFQSATVYYYTVDEMNDQPATAAGKVVRVSGKLVPDSFARENGSTVALFALTNGTEQLIASHTGVLPDLFFNDHSEIILEGIHNPGGVFISQNVIVKCPSKYVAVEEEERG